MPSHGGVYAFADGRGNVIQTVSAQNVRRSACFRLEPPEESASRRRADIRAVARRLWWIPTYSLFESSLVYLDVMRRLAPKDYQKQLGFGPVWFARVDVQERLGRWTPDKYAFKPTGHEIGPFERRASCLRFIELMEDLFDLCRYFDILQQTPNGQPCAYFEMGKCPAPCNGSISLERYREMMAASLRFAGGAYSDRLTELEAEMKRAAEGLQFERAGHIRETIHRARKLLDHSGLITQTPEDFRYLIVQRAERSNRVKPFFVDRGRITAGDSIPLKSVGNAVGNWIKRARVDARLPEGDRMHRSECIWLVSHFLLKGERAAGLFFQSREITTPDKLAHRIVERFRRTVPTGRDSATGSDTGIAEPSK